MDTNVLVSALRSSLGASYRLLQRVGTEAFELVVSAPLILEYEDVLKRRDSGVLLEGADIDAILDYLCSASRHAEIFYLWRPFLPDPKDDLVLEAAVAGECDMIVTFNLRDFHDIGQFGVRAVRPQDFLREIGVAR